MKRTNTFVVKWENPEEIQSLAVGCATLWNKLNYERRQAFFNNEFEFEDFKDETYEEFKSWIGSRTAQQVIRKNDSAWRSFFSLLRKWGNGELDGRPSPPGYWKRDDGSKELRIPVRNDDYTIDDGEIKLPFGRRGKVRGNPKWEGKQGQIEIQYDELDDCWRAFQSMEVKPNHQPRGNSVAFVDFGVVYPITAVVGDKAVAYNGKPLLSRWWHLTKRIESCQSELKKSRNKKSSEKLRRLFRERRRKLRDSTGKMAKDFVRRCWRNGVSRIVAGDLNGIRDSANFNKKANTMIHNFWSHKYVADRLEWTAENYGMEFELIDERGTSSKCPRCGEEESITRRGRRFKCNNCDLEAHRDVVGAQNIGFVWQGRTSEPTVKGSINGVMAHPEAVSI